MANYKIKCSPTAAPPPVRPIPPQSELRSLFTLCEETGDLTWKARASCSSWNLRCAGKRAGGVTPKGYLAVSVNGKRLMAHRIVWVMTNGPIPDGMYIDHINGICSDNRPENLRLATKSQNGRNQKMRKNNTSGITGVTWHEVGQRWQAKAGPEFLGNFVSKEEAAAVVNSYRNANGFSGRHGQ